LNSLRELLAEDVVAAAPALLGAILVRGECRARIVETEAYRGEDDPACHAFGKSKMKNMHLFGPPGFAYVYFNYGVHWMLNITAHEPGRGAGILIRAAEPLAGLEEMRSRRQSKGRPVADSGLLSGPGKLAQAFAVTGQDNGIDLLSQDDNLHLIPVDHPVENVIATTRIGIAEGKWHDVPWRFLDGDRLQWASRRPESDTRKAQ